MTPTQQATFIFKNDGKCPPEIPCNKCVNKRGQEIPCTNDKFAKLLAAEYLQSNKKNMEENDKFWIENGLRRLKENKETAIKNLQILTNHEDLITSYRVDIAEIEETLRKVACNEIH